MEGVSISDLVRRALAMHLAGGPSRWLELERAQCEEELGAEVFEDDTPPDVRRYGEWMRSLPAEARVLIHAVGEAATFERAHVFRELDVLESSPVPIWCLALERPLSSDMPIENQVEHIRRSGKVVACNGACKRLHGRTFCYGETASAGELPSALMDDGVLRDFVTSDYQLQGRLIQCGDHDGHHAPHDPPSLVVLHMLGQREAEGLVRIWGIEFETPRSESGMATGRSASSRHLPPAPPESSPRKGPPGGATHERG
jgi:hypothetical protein